MDINEIVERASRNAAERRATIGAIADRGDLLTAADAGGLLASLARASVADSQTLKELAEVVRELAVGDS